MPSPLQYAANRLNAEKSHGLNACRSGRARSSMNALRHGLTARVVVLPSEDMDAYQAFSKEIVDSLDPQTPVERQFAQTIADNQWRINQEYARHRRRHASAWATSNNRAIPTRDNPEIHSAMTARPAPSAKNSKAFVNSQHLRTAPAPFDERRSPPTQRAPGRAPRTPPSRNGRRHPPSQNA